MNILYEHQARSVRATVLRITVGVALLCGVLVGGATAAGGILPDGGGVIAYSALLDNVDIYLMDVGKRVALNLTRSDLLNEYYPTWSPDGDQIAFSLVGPDDNWDIYLMDWDGSHAQKLIGGESIDYFPVWSPDGNEMAYVSTSGGDYEIYVMNLHRNTIRQLTENQNLDDLPDWSLSGDQIVFESDRDGARQVYVMNVEGGDQIRLTDATGNAPSWSPDSQEIAFVSRSSSGWEISVMNADGSNLRQLTQNRNNDYTPSWSPTGRHITFVSEHGTPGVTLYPIPSELYLMNADGSNTMRLTDTDNLVHIGPASWRP